MADTSPGLFQDGHLGLTVTNGACHMTWYQMIDITLCHQNESLMDQT